MTLDFAPSLPLFLPFPSHPLFLPSFLLPFLSPPYLLISFHPFCHIPSLLLHISSFLSLSFPYFSFSLSFPSFFPGTRGWGMPVLLHYVVWLVFKGAQITSFSLSLLHRYECWHEWRDSEVEAGSCLVTSALCFCHRYYVPEFTIVRFPTLILCICLRYFVAWIMAVFQNTSPNEYSYLQSSSYIILLVFLCVFSR